MILPSYARLIGAIVTIFDSGIFVERQVNVLGVDIYSNVYVPSNIEPVWKSTFR